MDHASAEQREHMAEYAIALQELNSISHTDPAARHLMDSDDSPAASDTTDGQQATRHGRSSHKVSGPSKAMLLVNHWLTRIPTAAVADSTHPSGRSSGTSSTTSKDVLPASASQAKVVASTAAATEDTYLPSADLKDLELAEQPMQHHGQQTNDTYMAALDYLRRLNDQAGSIIKLQKEQQQDERKAGNSVSSSKLPRELLEGKQHPAEVLPAVLGAAALPWNMHRRGGRGHHQLLESTQHNIQPSRADASSMSAAASPAAVGRAPEHSAEASVANGSAAVNMTGTSQRAAEQLHASASPSEPEQASPADSTLAGNGPRLVACTLMKNEVPYLVEWIEFHRLMGFSHIAIYDDGSEDNAHLIESLYRQHGRDYISYDRQHEYEGDLVPADDFKAHARMRRVEAAGSCLLKYKHLADWIVHLDIDEFMWSPRHQDLRTFFQTGVPADMHVLYAGATRFGWEHMRHRHTYALEEVSCLLDLQSVPLSSWSKSPPSHEV